MSKDLKEVTAVKDEQEENVEEMKKELKDMTAIKVEQEESIEEMKKQMVILNQELDR